MLWHLGPPLAWWSPMKMSPFTFQTEFSLASDHSAWAPSQSCTENTHHQKRSPPRPKPFPWRSLREHMVTWLWDVRGLNVLRLLFPVKTFKLLGNDKSLWCLMLSIECGNKGDRRSSKVRCGGYSSNDSCYLVLVSNQLCSATAEERRDAPKTQFQWSHNNKARWKLENGAEAKAHWGQDHCCCSVVWRLQHLIAKNK